MKKIFKFLIWLILLLALGIGGYYIYITKIKKTPQISTFNLVPKESFFILQTNDISEAWTKLSNTPLWQKLIKTKYFKEWDEDINYVDMFLDSNKIAKYLFENQEIIMAAVVDKTNWDFLYLMNLSSASQIINDFNSMLNFIEGYKLKKSQLIINNNKYTILELIDEENPKDILYIAVINNVLAASYTKDIIALAIKEKDDNHWLYDKDFQEIIKNNTTEKIAKIYINYKILDDFANIYLTEKDPTIEMLSKTLKYSNLDFDVIQDRFILEGYTTIDTLGSYAQALISLKPGRLNSYKIMTNKTAAFISIGFSDFSEFYHNLLSQYEKTDPQFAAEMQKGLKILKNTFKIDIEKDLFGWIDNEITIYKIRPLSKQSRMQDIALVIKATDTSLALAGLQNITNQIRKISPFSFKKFNYRNFTINYLHYKKFFKFFFGKLFEKIEKPYYTAIDNYIVFTNSLELLEQIIDDYLKGQTIENNEKFASFIDDFYAKNTIAIFIQMPKMYPTLYLYTDPKDRKDLNNNKDLITSFSYIGLQFITDNKGFKSLLMTEYDPEAPTDELAQIMIQESEENLLTDFIDTMGYKIQISAAAKEEDGEYKEYYDPETQTKLKIEGKIQDGKMQGQWRTYYPDGKLKSIIPYVDDKIQGVAYFYYDNNENILRAEVAFSNDLPNGIYKEYHTNGAQKALLNYKNGILDGDAEFYYKTGALKIKGHYKKGKKHGKWIFYDKNGKKIKKEKWKKGVLKRTKNFE